jgi:hypothetical protein
LDLVCRKEAGEHVKDITGAGRTLPISLGVTREVMVQSLKSHLEQRMRAVWGGVCTLCCRALWSLRTALESALNSPRDLVSNSVFAFF